MWPTLLPLAIAAITPDDAASWLEQAVPLPRDAKITDVIEVAPEDVALVVRPGAAELVGAAADELSSLLATAGEPPQRRERPGEGINLILGTVTELGPWLQRVRLPRFERRPNPDQAYAIRPLPDQGGLILAAPQPLGVYYGAKTLQQLLAARRRPGSLVLPLLTVDDSPAMAERGFWGGDASQDLAWLSDHKFNLVEVHAKLGFAADGTPTATMPDGLLADAARRGITIVPIIHHLDQLESTGLFQRHPELDGGPPEGMEGLTLRRVKLDAPKFTEVMAGWFTALAQLDGVDRITVWLSEEQVHHPLADPAQDDFVVEVQVLQSALAAARKVEPELKLRVLTTQGSYKSNDKILAMVAPDTAVIYYDGSRTYNSSRQPMIDPLLRDWAADKSHWLGVCPQLTPDWRGVAPWHGGEFIQARMKEFLDAGVRTLVGYAPPARRYSPYNLEATAEWSWNPSGRDPKTFAHAYAVRRGLVDPARFAEWATTIGPVAWDVYGSRVIVRWCYGSSVPAVTKGGLKLGEGILAEFPSEARFATDLAACATARDLAATLGDPALQHETAAVGGLVELLQRMYRLNGLLPSAEKLSEEQRAEVQQHLAAADQAAEQAAAALRAWGDQVSLANGGGGRFDDTVNAILEEAAGLAAEGEKLGFPDPRKPFRPAVIGTWKTDDFDQQGTLDAVYEVTDRMGGPGPYEVDFRYKNGLLGLVVSKVTLVAQTGDDEATRHEVAVDEHRAHCGAWNEGNLYHLNADKVEPGRRWFVVATISGGQPTTPKEQRTTAGEVSFRQLEQP